MAGDWLGTASGSDGRMEYAARGREIAAFLNCVDAARCNGYDGGRVVAGSDIHTFPGGANSRTFCAE
jgi:hypothetical protein